MKKYWRVLLQQYEIICVGCGILIIEDEDCFSKKDISINDVNHFDRPRISHLITNNI